MTAEGLARLASLRRTRSSFAYTLTGFHKCRGMFF